MDKRVIFAVAGAGKTTYIVNGLSLEKRVLIITYTDGNYNNLSRKILNKFNGIWPSNIVLMTYFSFLYQFCYKPYLSDKVKAKGLTYRQNPNIYANQSSLDYYITASRLLYSNRLSLFIEKEGISEKLNNRIERFFDKLIIDEVQDLAGRDFNLLLKIMEANINMLFVGDYYQHTYDTSRDGNVNKNLFDNRKAYEARFYDKGFVCDNTTLDKSWRCGKGICRFIKEKLLIDIGSYKTDDEGDVFVLTSKSEIESILEDDSIVKLYYKNGKKHGYMHKNWGETKGEDLYQDVCVLLNKSTSKLFKENKLSDLAPLTKNKLYVALTRARGNVYLVDE